MRPRTGAVQRTGTGQVDRPVRKNPDGLAAPAASLLLPLVALDEGIFKKHGLDDVEVTFMPGPQLVPAAAGGAFEIAMVAPPTGELTALQGGGSLQTVAAWGKNLGSF